MSTERESESADNHVYDGIHELDNPMPRWWVATFVATIIFSYFYIDAVHFASGRLISDEYAAEMQARAAVEAKLALSSEAVSEESLAALMRDKVMMGQAHVKFVATCSVCHGERAQGLIGPNLTDDAWKNCEGDLMGIHGIIDHGVTTRGMPAWGRQLSPTEVRQLAAYVGTLRGTNVPGGKQPEGHIVQAVQR